MIIIDDRNYDKSLGACKGPPTLKDGENPADDISPESDNSGIEANNDCAT